MINIGCVLYRKGDEPGTLYAKWCHSIFGNGTGKAVGGPSNGFMGRYHIHYFDDKGAEIADLELDIQKDGDFFKLAWISNGKITSRGIGMEVAEGLAAGWCGVDDKLL